MIITVQCPREDWLGPIPGCGSIFEADTDKCDDMIDCRNCGLFFDPCHPNSQPQTLEARSGWAAHITAYDKAKA